MKHGIAEHGSRPQKEILNALYFLRVIISNTRLYSLEHPKTKEMISSAYTSISKILRVVRQLTILIIDNDLVVNNKTIRCEEADYFSLFITVLQKKNIAHVTFKRGLTIPELTQFLASLSAKNNDPVYNGPGISSGELQLKDDVNLGTSEENQGDSIPPEEEMLEEAKEQSLPPLSKLKILTHQRQALAREFYFPTKKKQSVILHKLRDNMASFSALFTRSINSISLLTTQKAEDEYIFTHVINVCILTLSQAKSLGFTGNQLNEIGTSATLYDIGWTFIPDEILNKAGAVDQKEQDIIKAHTIGGAKYLLSLNDAPRLAVLAALEHHIHFDGGGYPSMGPAWNTNIVSQMIAIADTYDSMRCKRPFRRPSSEKIIRSTLIKGKGSMFNPLLVDNFISILSENQQ